MEYACGMVRALSTMRCAMMLRMRDMGTTCGGAGVLDEGCGGAVFADPPSAIYRRMSSLVMRPSEPLPAMRPRSRLFSLAMRRTRGEDRMRAVPMAGLAGP